MASNNPYEAPQNNVITDSDITYGEINILSADGRLGRLRYFAYSLGVVILLYIAMGIGMGLASILPETASAIVIGILGLIAMVAIVYVSFVLMIQRLHDTNNTGWLSLIIFIPLVSIFLTLYLWFMPGTAEANRFGNPPPPSNKAAFIIVLVFAFIVIIGILAAIAIPAYDQYLIKAQEAGAQLP